MTVILDAQTATVPPEPTAPPVLAATCPYEGRDGLGRRTCCDKLAGHRGRHAKTLSEDY